MLFWIQSGTYSKAFYSDKSFTPRKVSIHLSTHPLTQELEWMQQVSVTEKDNQVNEWVSSIVITDRESKGNLTTCLNPKGLSQITISWDDPHVIQIQRYSANKMGKITFGGLDYPFGLDFSNDVLQSKVEDHYGMAQRWRQPWQSNQKCSRQRPGEGSHVIKLSGGVTSPRNVVTSCEGLLFVNMVWKY